MKDNQMNNENTEVRTSEEMDFYSAIASELDFDNQVNTSKPKEKKQRGKSKNAASKAPALHLEDENSLVGEVNYVVDSKETDEENNQENSKETDEKINQETSDGGKQFEMLQKEYEELKERYSNATKNMNNSHRESVVLKKKVTQFINELKENEYITEEHVESAKNIFANLKEEIAQDDTTVEQEEPRQVSLKERMDKVLNEYIKWNKDKKEVEESYHAFFAFSPFLSPKEQKEIQEYLSAEQDDSAAIRQIIQYGEQLHKSLGKAYREYESPINYIKHLEKTVKKLEEKTKTMSHMLDSSTRSIYNNTNNQINRSLNQKRDQFYEEIGSELF